MKSLYITDVTHVSIVVKKEEDKNSLLMFEIKHCSINLLHYVLINFLSSSKYQNTYFKIIRNAFKIIKQCDLWQIISSKFLAMNDLMKAFRTVHTISI